MPTLVSPVTMTLNRDNLLIVKCVCPNAVTYRSCRTNTLNIIVDVFGI